MMYTYRCRHLINVITTNQAPAKADDALTLDHLPLEAKCYKEFKKLSKRYSKNDTYAKTVAIAKGRGYIGSFTNSDGKEVLGVKPAGIELLTITGFANEVAKSVSMIVPLLVSVAAIIISIFALNQK